MNSMTKAYQEAAQIQKRDKLVIAHLEYVRQVCGTMARSLPPTTDLQNLYSAGVVGLIEAAQKFDEARGVLFKTFSYRRIRGAIIDEIRRSSPLSQSAMNLISRIRGALETMEPPVTPELLASNLGLKISEVEDGLAAMKIAYPVPWEEAEYSRSSGESPDARMNHAEKISILTDSIEQLADRDRQVLQLYYMEELTLKEIGAVLGISESRVSRILSRAELTLKETIRKRDQD